MEPACSFQDDRPCQPLWLKVSVHHGTHLCSSPERCVLRDARHVDPLIVMVFGFVVLIVILIVVDIVMVVDVVVLSCISAVVPFVVV